MVHHDHSAKQNTDRWIYGHCRVLIGFLVKRHERWACLPMEQENYVPAKAIRQASKKDKWSRTKNGIAARLVCFVVRLFGLPVLVVCDSWFGNIKDNAPIFDKGCPEPVKRAIKYVSKAMFRPAA